MAFPILCLQGAVDSGLLFSATEFLRSYGQCLRGQGDGFGRELLLLVVPVWEERLCVGERLVFVDKHFQSRSSHEKTRTQIKVRITGLDFHSFQEYGSNLIDFLLFGPPR